MRKLKIYSNYALIIMLYTIIFIPITITTGQILNNLFPKFDGNTKYKNKVVIYTEITLQILSIVIITYFYREIIDYFMLYIFKIKKYGTPEKYASLILAPVIFSSQPSLINKIRYLWKIKSPENTYYYPES